MRPTGIRDEGPYPSETTAGGFGPPDGHAARSPYAGHPGHHRGHPATGAPARVPRQGGRRLPGSDQGGGGRGRGNGRRRRPRWARLLIITASCLALLIAATAAGGWLYLRHLDGNLAKEDLHIGENKLDKAPPNAAGQTPLNILLLGSDARDSEENIGLGGARHTAGEAARADVQLLLHVAADRSNITVISVPRDTVVTIPTCTDSETGEVYPEVSGTTINHSLGRGGPGCTVAAWEQLTGVPIDHFMMLDFAGVVDMADAVGGVPVCVDANVYDPDSGLRLTEGEHVVEGEQALQWLRTRHGFRDGSDVGRTQAQQMYLSSMVRELKASARLTDPLQLKTLAEAATNALTVDRELGSVAELYNLAEELREVPVERINMITMPWIEAPENPTAWVAPEPGAADELFALVREDIALDAEEAGDTTGAGEGSGETTAPPPADPTPVARDAVRLVVRNGTQDAVYGAVPGRAGVVADELIALGFTATEIDTWLVQQSETALLYPSDADREAAELIAEELGLPDRAIRVSPSAEQIILVVGNDWREGGTFPAATSEESAADREQLDTEDVLEAEDSSACMAVNPFYTF